MVDFRKQAFLNGWLRKRKKKLDLEMWESLVFFIRICALRSIGKQRHLYPDYSSKDYSLYSCVNPKKYKRANSSFFYRVPEDA